MTQFAKALGMPEYGFGLLAALPFIGTFMQVPASFLQVRYGHRKQLMLICGLTGRALWIVTALLPWLMPGARDWWWQAMIISLAISWLISQASIPAWINWMSDVIPQRIRGRFMARRNFIGQPVGMISALAVGYFLDLAMQYQGQRPDMMLEVTSVVLVIAGLIGVVEILIFGWIDDPAADRPPQPLKFVVLMREPLKSKNFRRYLQFNFTFMLSVGFIGQYLWLYLLDICAWSNTRANMYAIVVPLTMTMIGYPVWGRLVDRLGKKPVLLISGLVVSFGALGWLFVTPQQLFPGYALVLLTLFAWPGMEISNFNIMLGMAGGDDSKRPGLGAAYVALNSIAVAIGGTLSGLLAGVTAKWLVDFHYVVPLAGITLTYHGILFLGSTVLRLLAMLFALGLTEPKAVGTWEAMRYMSYGLYSNVRQALLMPTRVVGRLVHRSYRIDRY